MLTGTGSRYKAAERRKPLLHPPACVIWCPYCQSVAGSRCQGRNTVCRVPAQPHKLSTEGNAVFKEIRMYLNPQRTARHSSTRSPSWPRWSPAPHAECSARLSLPSYWNYRRSLAHPVLSVAQAGVRWRGLASRQPPPPSRLPWPTRVLGLQPLPGRCPIWEVGSASARPPRLGSEERLCPATNRLGSEERLCPATHRLGSEERLCPATHRLGSEERLCPATHRLGSEERLCPATHRLGSEERLCPAAPSGK
ncbi:uncharacterized protein [Symphalangus syndactylus]|uniref:uncharacterized protein n=1 Tax=Symphalangus syndactylus TaxID=9590 RepID=UPI003003F279